MNELFVNMGQLSVLRNTGILTTIGLGSCIGVALYDPVVKVGAMAHVFLYKSHKDKDPKALPGKYADLAIPSLVQITINQGARKERLYAKLAGGAHLFANLPTKTLSVGEKNIRAVKQQLSIHNIPITGQDLAGNYGRKMRLFVETGIVIVTAIGKDSKAI